VVLNEGDFRPLLAGFHGKTCQKSAGIDQLQVEKSGPVLIQDRDPGAGSGSGSAFFIKESSGFFTTPVSGARSDIEESSGLFLTRSDHRPDAGKHSRINSKGGNNP